MKKQLTLIGMGTGSENFLTIEAESALRKAQIIFGAKRILEIAENSLRSGFSEERQAESGKNLPKSEPLYRAEEIFSYLKENPQYEKASVVFSGDVGFFSGAETFFSFLGTADKSSEKVKPEVCDWEINVIPGISSAVYFASKLQKSWQNWKFLSLHGAKCNAIGQIRKNPGCFFILSGIEDVRNLGKMLEKAIKNRVIPEVNCYLGSNLSYDVEKIIQISPEKLAFYQEKENSEADNLNSARAVSKTAQTTANLSDNTLKNSLFVLLVENEGAKSQPVMPFLNDEDFIRGEKIPMTKKEVRRLSLASLGLSETSIFYDIGSGTGSVTVEAARIATEGHVFAVECSEEAFELTKKNVDKFCLENVTCILGKAPECLDFPSPTHVFIGGSKGNLREIVEFVLKKNPKVRIVANFVSLENLCEMQNLLKSLEEEDRIENAEITQLAVSHAERTGDFHLMKAQNPVYIVSFSGKAGEE